MIHLILSEIRLLRSKLISDIYNRNCTSYSGLGNPTKEQESKQGEYVIIYKLTCTMNCLMISYVHVLCKQTCNLMAFVVRIYNTVQSKCQKPLVSTTMMQIRVVFLISLLKSCIFCVRFSYHGMHSDRGKR